MLAIAKTAGIPLNIDDFQRISDKIPLIGDLKPSGKYRMEDVHNIGGVPAILKYLLSEGLLNGDCMTVTGKSMKQNLESVPALPKDQKIILPVQKPIKPTGHIAILRGIRG